MIANDRRADPNHTLRSFDVHGCCASAKIKANNMVDNEEEILFHLLVLKRRQHQPSKPKEALGLDAKNIHKET